MISRRILLQSASVGAAFLAPASGITSAAATPGPASGAGALKPGFLPAEARTLLEIAEQTYNGTPTLSYAAKTCGVPDVPAPSSEWTLRKDLTPTRPTLLDNYWQVWQNKIAPKQYAIAVRGTVATASSVLADLLVPLINARFDVTINGLKLPLCRFARAEGQSAVKAGVHSGFALSLLLMLLTTDKPLIATLLKLQLEAGSQVFITGHSQGASIATLLTSLVGRAAPMFQGPSYKTYVFAPAKPGNDHYAYDYAQLGGVSGYAWAVASTQDWVPQAPLTIEWFQDINTPNPLRHFGDALDAQLMTGLAVDTGGQTLAVSEALNSLKQSYRLRLNRRVEKLSSQLAGEAINLKMSDLGAASSASVTGSMIGDILKQILDQIQDSLNYADAGALVPLLAVPGGNPKDGTGGCQTFDYFWQHHLGNYYKYLNEQYPV